MNPSSLGQREGERVRRGARETSESPHLPISLSPHLPSFLVALLGARMQYAVPRILCRAGRLRRLFTDLDGRSAAFRWLRLLPKRCLPQAVTRLTNRFPEDIPQALTTSFNSLGLGYAWRRRRVKGQTELTGIFLATNREFCRRVCGCDWEAAEAVYTFNAAGLEILQQARRRGLRTVCEQTIAPYAFEQRILQEERALHPKWETDEEDRLAGPYIDREQREWPLSDRILCGSEFVRAAIGACGGPVERCHVVPYGVDVDCKLKIENSQFPISNFQSHFHSGPIRVLTVGTVGLRKGAAYVLEAARCLGSKAVFRMVGPSALSPFGERNLREAVELTGAVPRTSMAEHYAWADLFLLPSVCEGSATATYEAIANGLPVICTHNTGSVVEDGVHGFVVSLRDVAAIVARIAELNDDRPLLARLSRQAMERSREFTVAGYASRLLSVLAEMNKEGGKTENLKI